MLDLEEEEDYDATNALEHINQAIFELADDMEINGLNDFSLYTMTADWDDQNDQDVPSAPAYWDTLPGRFRIVDVCGAPLSDISHIKKMWLGYDGVAQKFEGRDIREMLDEYGDEEGTPETYTVDGEYVVVRPVPAQGYSYDVRAMFQRTPSTYTASDEPMIMAQAPYAVIYRACEIASVWNIDDNATVKFSKLAQRAIDRYAMRATMVNDSARNMEDFNG